MKVGRALPWVAVVAASLIVRWALRRAALPVDRAGMSAPAPADDAAAPVGEIRDITTITTCRPDEPLRRSVRRLALEGAALILVVAAAGGVGVGLLVGGGDVASAANAVASEAAVSATPPSEVAMPPSDASLDGVALRSNDDVQTAAAAADVRRIVALAQSAPAAPPTLEAEAEAETNATPVVEAVAALAGIDAGEPALLELREPDVWRREHSIEALLAELVTPADWIVGLLPDPQELADRIAGDLSPLRDELEPAFANFAAQAGVAVVDLQSGEWFSINSDVPFNAASTIKFFVTLSALRDIEGGLYSFADIDADLTGIMVRQSNASARELTLRTGIRTVNERLAAWGLSKTQITHPAGYQQEQDPLYESTDNLTTPTDAAHALELLYHARIAAPELSRSLLERLSQAPRALGIEGAVPDGEGKAFYKVGWLPESDLSAVHDIGIVEFERAGETRAYAIAIYTQGTRPQYSAWLLVERTAATVWNFFANERYPQTDGAPTLLAALP